MKKEEIYALWKDNRARDAYDGACALAQHRGDSAALHMIERAEMSLHVLVTDAVREAVAARDDDWLRSRLATGAAPPSFDNKDGAELRSRHREERRRLVFAHLAAGLAAPDGPAEAGRPDRIEAALAALDGAEAEAGLDPTSIRRAAPFGLMRDLAACLGPASTGPRPAVASGRGRALLVERAQGSGDWRGRLASIECELVAGGGGDVYPHPDQVFTMRDEDFLGSERQARAFLGPFLPEGEAFDLRWRLRLDGEVGVPRVLYGPSCGAALALAACRAAALLSPPD